ncbi:MAG: hypothetical protein KF805_15495 [Phycisphaeraceae bacterium]|nr:hypothetical protein [Phycisphaeraceae bacterium]
MAAFIRFILVLSLLAQSFPALAMQRCAGMPEASARVAANTPQDQECGCCQLGVSGAPDCPLSSQAFADCNCRASQQEAPKTPPPGPENKPLTQLLAFVPVLMVFVREPAVLSFVWHGDDALLRRSSPSIQSLLCVWLI